MGKKLGLLVIVGLLLAGLAWNTLYQTGSLSVAGSDVAVATLPASIPAAVMQQELSDFQGDKHHLGAYSGPLLINFWATWCPPCLEEIPRFVAWQDKMQGKVQWVGIALDDKDEVSAWLAENKVNYPILIQDTETVINMAAQMGNTMGVLPFSVLVDGQGRVLMRQFGSLSDKVLAQALKKL